MTKKNNTNSTSNNNSTASVSKVELFGQAINKFVHTNKDKVIKTDGKDEWKIKDADLGKGATDYRVVIETIKTKSGRDWKKFEMFRMQDGKERVVQFGSFKKKYLYKLAMALKNGLNSHSTSRLPIDKDTLNKIASDIRANKSKYSFDGKTLTGKSPAGDIKYIETEQVNKKGKKSILRQLYIDGALKMEGCGLGSIKPAFTKQHHSKADKAAVAKAAEDSVADLI